MFNKEVIRNSDKLYIVLRKIRKNLNPILEVWKEQLGADVVIHNNEYYFFCEEVTEAEIVD